MSAPLVRPAYFYIAALAACQSGDSNASAAPSVGSAQVIGTSRTIVEARDANGTSLARVVGDRPCRATIAGTDFIVGREPLLMQVGATKFEGHLTDSSVVFTQDGAAIARLLVTTDELSLFGPDGAALIRASVSGGDAIVRDKGGSPVREIRRAGDSVIVSSSAGDTTVTGIADLLLAAVVTATEASPEVRALAACHRLQKAAY